MWDVFRLKISISIVLYCGIVDCFGYLCVWVVLRFFDCFIVDCEGFLYVNLYFWFEFIMNLLFWCVGGFMLNLFWEIFFFIGMFKEFCVGDWVKGKILVIYCKEEYGGFIILIFIVECEDFWFGGVL